MRSKMLILFITAMMIITLTACGNSDTLSVTQEENGAAAQEQTGAAAGEVAETEEVTEEEEDDYEIPTAVLNLTEEEDALLTGTLKDGVYTNEYFGYRFTTPEGWAVLSMNGEAEGEELMRFSETYADGLLGIMIIASSQESNDNIGVSVSDIPEDDRGKTEEELLQAYLDINIALYEDSEEESTAHLEKVKIAGEEHPAIVETLTQEDGTENTSVYVIFVKDSFQYSVSFYAEKLPLEELLKCIQKI